MAAAENAVSGGMSGSGDGHFADPVVASIRQRTFVSDVEGHFHDVGAVLSKSAKVCHPHPLFF